MVKCYESNHDGVVLVQDFLLKKDLYLPAILPDKPNKLYKEQKGARHIKAVKLYDNFHDSINKKYHNKMCPKP